MHSLLIKGNQAGFEILNTFIIMLDDAESSGSIPKLLVDSPTSSIPRSINIPYFSNSVKLDVSNQTIIKVIIIFVSFRFYTDKEIGNMPVQF